MNDLHKCLQEAERYYQAARALWSEAQDRASVIGYHHERLIRPLAPSLPLTAEEVHNDVRS